MLLGFTKYKSSGNNFIIIDNRDRKYKFTGEQIKFLCDFKNGIGSDGLLVINKSKNLDFKVDFYNPDSTKAFVAACLFVEGLFINPAKPFSV